MFGFYGGNNGAMVNELLETVGASEDPVRVSQALESLIPLTLSNASLMGRSISKMTAALQCFPENQEIQRSALQIIINIANRSLHASQQEADATARAIVNGGVVDMCMERIRAETRTAVVVDFCCQIVINLTGYRCFQPIRHRSTSDNGHADILSAMIHALQRFPRDAKVQAHGCGALHGLTDGVDGPENDKVLRSVAALGGLELAVAAMREYPRDAHVQSSATGVLCHCSFFKPNVPKVQELGSIELVVKAMQAHLGVVYVQLNGCNFLRSMANNPSAHPLVGTADVIECIVAAMRKYPEFEHLQFKASAALWNYTANPDPNTRTLAVEAGAIQVAVAAMTKYERSAEVQEHVIGFLWNMCSTEEHRVALAEAGCVPLIAKAMETHRQSQGVQKEGAGALYLLAASNDRSVRLALTSSNAIPALRYLFSKYNTLANSMMFSGNFGGFGLDDMMFSEKVGEALDRLGVLEHNVIGEEDYDPDDDVGEYPIESPPFDICALEDKDLAKNAPGWYAADMFDCDDYRSHELGPSYLRVQIKPSVGQKVCLRVVLPYGGRGYVYGTVSEIAPAPTNKQLRKTSKIFGKGCPCSEPLCRLKNGTREEIVATFGAVHGQEVVATVSLSEGREHNDRKARFAPLPAFFEGEEARYKMVIRLDEVRKSWDVVRIERIDDDATDEGEIWFDASAGD